MAYEFKVIPIKNFKVCNALEYTLHQRTYKDGKIKRYLTSKCIREMQIKRMRSAIIGIWVVSPKVPCVKFGPQIDALRRFCGPAGSGV